MLRRALVALIALAIVASAHALVAAEALRSLGL